MPSPVWIPLAWTAFALPVLAQGTYPVRPIRLVVPFAPGGPVDTLGRTLAPRIGEALGQQVVIDNRGGGGSLIGTDLVAKAAPDGHTLLITSSAIAINPSMFAKLPYDVQRDLAPITIVNTGPLVLVVHPSLPVKSLRDLMALARARKGDLVYASSGAGSMTHLAGELFNTLASVRMQHVPYKGAAPATVDLLAGHVSIMFNNMVSAVPHVRTGRLRALGLADEQRSPALPDVPTMTEAGMPGHVASGWNSMYAPAGTPRDIIDRVQREVAAALRHADVRARLAALGLDPVGSTPEQLAAMLSLEIAKWAKVVKASGARID
jgi:tripartite-type tricarboxylate transporter receptor subunit TctC